MYVPPHFRERRDDVITDLIRQHPFGILVTDSGSGSPTVSHLAFTYSPPAPGERFGVVHGHLASANPQCAAVRAGAQCTVVFQGPSHYISPRYYVTAPSTPTWNYTAVHASGDLIARPSSDAADLVLDHLTTNLEREFDPPFQYRSLSPAYTATRKPGILAFDVAITQIDAQFKMSQNRTREDRESVIDELRKLRTPESTSVAHIMEDLLRCGFPKEEQ